MKLGLNEDIICLASGHSMIMGNMPKDKLNLKQVGEKVMKDIMEGTIDTQHFGLFDTSQPNYSTYYPDVTAKDLNPTEEEFVYPVFRMLSETTVHKSFNPISFSKRGVLKKSMNMLIGQTINVDHETAVGNAIGTILSVEWQKSYEDKSGVVIPAGINAVLMIDAKANPRLARGVMMTPPSIHSNSVTIQFKWEKSHPDMESDEFWSKLGTYDKEGVLIERVASDIVSYSETSLVAHGADPYAKKLEGGKIVLAKHAHDRASLSETQTNIQDNRFAPFSYQRLGQVDTISNSEGNPTIPISQINNKHQNDLQMKELLLQLAASTSFEFEGELNKEALMAHVTSLSTQLTESSTKNEDLTTEVTDLKENVETLETEKSNLTVKVEELTPLSELGTTHLSNVKTEAARLYNVAKADKADEAIVNLINGADINGASAFLKQFTAEVEENHSASCTDCGSKNVTRASRQLGDTDSTLPGKGGEGNTEPKSKKELKEELRNLHNTSSITRKKH
jgi:hypothetical protein